MSKVRIITDSNAFLPPDVVEKYGIAVIPHRIKVGGSFFEEDADFSTEEMFEKLHEAQRMGVSRLPEVQSVLRAAGSEKLFLQLRARLVSQVPGFWRTFLSAGRGARRER